jgi:hypothetical protein
MNDIKVVKILEGVGDLTSDVKDLFFCEGLLLFEFFEHQALQIAFLGVLHDEAQLISVVDERFLQAYDVWVRELLVNLHFVVCDFDLFLCQGPQVDDFLRKLLFVGFPFNEDDLTEAAVANGVYELVEVFPLYHDNNYY